jgi:hypothetical protein
MARHHNMAVVYFCLFQMRLYFCTTGQEQAQPSTHSRVGEARHGCSQSSAGWEGAEAGKTEGGTSKRSWEAAASMIALQLVGPAYL